MKDIEIYGVGNAIVDLQVPVADEVLTKLGLTKSTMGLVTLEKQQELRAAVFAPPIKSSGGSLTNSIITLAQLGSKTAYSCAVGDDEDGMFYAEELSALGVIADVHCRDGGPTGTSVVMITPDAERTMSTHLGASFTFGINDLSPALIERSEWMFVEGYLLGSPVSLEAALAAMDLAAIHGTKLAFTCSDVFIINAFREVVEKLVKASSLTFANIAEARALVGSDGSEDPKQLFEKLIAFCGGDCVMTMSEKGAMIHLDGERVAVPGEKVRAVDETGAGDVFAGTFLYGILNKRSAEESGRLACKLASKVVSKLGARLTNDLIERF